MRRLAFLLLFCLPSWASWNYCYPLTYDHTQVGSSDSSGFPALVSFNAAAMQDSAHGGDVQSSSGADILFFSDSGLTTQLASELDFYDNVNGIGWFWVEVPTLSHSSNGTIYMAVGNTSPPSRAANPWDANYKGVWHLSNGTTLTANDSTTNANHGTPQNAPAAAGGKIDGGAGFAAASEQYISTANLVNAAVVTVSAWVNLPSYPASNGTVVAFANGLLSGTTDKQLFIGSDGTVGFHVYDGGDKEADSGSAIGTGSWVYLVGVADGTHAIVYVNGSPAGSSAAGDTYTGYSVPNIFINGLFPGGSSPLYMSVLIDESRVSNVARSADWIEAEYANQNAPGNIGSPGFWTFGARTALGIARKRTIVVQ